MSGSRNPAAVLPSMSGGVRGGDVAGVLAAIRALPFASGSTVEASLDGTTSVQAVPHGLGRAYRGAFLMSEWTVTGETVKVLDPRPAASLGYDVSRYVVLVPTAAGAGIATLWVF